jgi:LuxR family maltose regulon positive regulatory protein
MSEPLLLTKLYIPPPQLKVVLRPRLIQKLNEGQHDKLTLISAPAGFGKTTLVSEWISNCERPTAWVSLDEGDNDLARFLAYLISALQGIAANIGRDLLDMIHNAQHQLPSTELLLTELLNEISTIPNNFIVVLDDYHAIDSKAVGHAVAFLVDHLPPQMQLVITSREDPPLPLARLRTRGQLTELRAVDLRFTAEEAAAFLNEMMNLNLSVENINALETRTEGWIAGLQLAALSMQGHQDHTSFIRSFTGSHHFVLDYLIEEVLHQQPESVQAFLLRTSILDRLCGSLCDAVMGLQSDPGQETLEYLERSNLFIVPLDNERHWYRYHHLFADVLQMHLKVEQPDQVSDLHHRACEWYEHEGSLENAVHHALAARDFSRAADLIEMIFPVMNRNRQFTTLLGWLKAIPDELVRVRPVLSTEYALVSISCGEVEGAESRLRDAERCLEISAAVQGNPESTHEKIIVVDKEEFRRVAGMIPLIRAAQTLARGDYSETEKNARQVLAHALESDYLMLGGAASQLGLVAWAKGDLNTAHRMTAEGMANVRRAGYISPAIGAAITMADIQIVQGRLHEAMSTYEQALHWAMEPNAPIRQGAADMYVGMSSLQYEHNDLKTAEQLLLTSQALGDLARLPQNPYRWRAAMAQIRVVHGDLEGALELLDQAEQLYDGNFSPNVRPIATRRIRIWITQGRLDEALDWARGQGLSTENDLYYLREYDHITFARMLLASPQKSNKENSIPGVIGLLERLLKAAEEGARKGSMLEIRILQSLAFHAQGDLPAALLPLRHALAMAEPEGYVRIFLDQGPNMMRLLREASAQGIMPEYTTKLLAAFDAEQQINESKPGVSPASQAQPLIEPLSQRELEILKLIAIGLSNREIGERLFLALDTIKGHNRKIFDKLQVESRTEAIARARELKLV